MRKLIFKSKFPQFFKIILQEAVAQGRLEIPRRFVKKCGNDLPDNIFLQVPGGSLWKVELVKRDNGLWLHNGWREFQEYYSIAHGSFLVFKYIRRSYFHVVIFDKSATEIDYPYDDDDDDDDNNDSKELMFERECKEERTERNVDDSASVEILDDSLPSSKKKEKSPLPCPRPPKVGRTSSASKPDNSKAELHTSASAKRGDRSVSCRKQKKNRIVNNRSNNLKNLRRNTSRTSEPQEIAASTALKKSRAFAKALGFKSENPSFVVVMKRAYVYGTSVSIPFKFATNHLKQNGDDVILQISEGKTWTVSCIMYSDHKVARLSSGWSAFARDNNLKTGEKCVFELINRAELVLNVVIIRASEEKITRLAEPREKFCCAKTMRTTESESPSFKSEDSCNARGKHRLSGHKRKLSNIKVRTNLTADKKSNALYRAIAAFQSANPSFTRFMQPSYVRNRLDIPFRFAKTHFKEDNSEIVLQHSDGRTWTVCCRIKIFSQRAYFNIRWNAFVQDNNLKVGNICVFELIKSAELVVKVSIIRAGDSRPSVGSIRGSRVYVVERNTDRVRSMCSPDGKSAAGRQFPERPSRARMPKAVEAAEKFTPMHSYFKASMNTYNLCAGVAVPTKFMELIREEADNVMLQLPNGENRWPVKLVRYPAYKVWKLTAGWKAFSRENRLQVGDICAFELVGTEPLLLKVSIFRCND